MAGGKSSPGQDQPLSPLSALVRRQPNVALVRAISLKEASDNILDPQIRRNSKDSVDKSVLPPPSMPRARAASAGRLRPLEAGSSWLRDLSREEVVCRNMSSANYFQEARDINENVRKNSKDTEAILSEVRKLRPQIAAAAAASKQPSRSFSMPTLQAPQQCSPRNAVRGMAARLAHSSLKSDGPKQEEEAEEEAKEVEQDHENQPALQRAPTKSLMEKFGYGVKPKTPEFEDKVEPSAPPAHKRGEFFEVKAGNNDLLERLAERRKAAMKAPMIINFMKNK
jgi:hypothetical protein